MKKASRQCSMRRKNGFCVALAAMLFALCAAAYAQQPKKLIRIGYLVSSDAATASVPIEGIRLALRELGYIEKQNIAIEYRYAEGKDHRSSELAAELVRLKPDIILVSGGTLRWVRPVMNATKTIPIIMTGAGADPVRAGLVESLARPGGNVTGITNVNEELSGKQLELFKEAVPKLARVAFLYDPRSPVNLRRAKEVLPAAARGLGLTVRSWEVRDGDEFEIVFAAIGKERPNGLIVSPGPLTFANGQRIAGFAIKNRLPSMYGRRQDVEAGGFMSYGADITESYRRVAIYVDRILKGAKPADLPIEQPKKFELVLNLKTAKQIGLVIPPNVLARADRVIR
jgi:putative ABC transport system substrate-binding protein